MILNIYLRFIQFNTSLLYININSINNSSWLWYYINNENFVSNCSKSNLLNKLRKC